VLNKKKSQSQSFAVAKRSKNISIATSSKLLDQSDFFFTFRIRFFWLFISAFNIARLSPGFQRKTQT
jgi:hypothetical protein